MSQANHQVRNQNKKITIFCHQNVAIIEINGIVEELNLQPSKDRTNFHQKNIRKVARTTLLTLRIRLAIQSLLLAS